MERFYCVVFCLLLFGVSNAQSSEGMPERVVSIMNKLSGEFKWTMKSIKSKKIVREGSSKSHFELDSMILMSHETFDNSNVKQISYLGYRESDSTFFLIAHYNIDVGPHIMYGKLIDDLTILFYENDTSRLYLHIKHDSGYMWTYQEKQEHVWVDRDMVIEFIKKS